MLSLLLPALPLQDVTPPPPPLFPSPQVRFHVGSLRDLSHTVVSHYYWGAGSSSGVQPKHVRLVLPSGGELDDRLWLQCVADQPISPHLMFASSPFPSLSYPAHHNGLLPPALPTLTDLPMSPSPHPYFPMSHFAALFATTPLRFHLTRTPDESRPPNSLFSPRTHPTAPPSIHLPLFPLISSQGGMGRHPPLQRVGPPLALMLVARYRYVERLRNRKAGPIRRDDMLLCFAKRLDYDTVESGVGRPSEIIPLIPLPK